MKKIPISIGAGVIIFLAGMGINFAGYKMYGDMPLSVKSRGGEIIEEYGFGLRAAHIYSMSPDGHDSYEFGFDPLSTVICLGVCIVLCIIIGRIFYY